MRRFGRASGVRKATFRPSPPPSWTRMQLAIHYASSSHSRLLQMRSRGLRRPWNGQACTLACGGARGSCRCGVRPPSIPKHCFVLEVNSPGLLVIKESRGEDTGKFANVAVLEGDLIKVLSEDPINLPDCLPLVRSLLGFGLAGSPADDLNVMLQLAVSMRRHGRGGSLLVVPSTQRKVARIHCSADSLFGIAAVSGAAGAASQRLGCARPDMEKRAPPDGRCHRRTDGRGWRYGNERLLPTDGFRREDWAAIRKVPGWNRWWSPSRS